MGTARASYCASARAVVIPCEVCGTAISAPTRGLWPLFAFLACENLSLRWTTSVQTEPQGFERLIFAESLRTRVATCDAPTPSDASVTVQKRGFLLAPESSPF